MSAIPHHTSDPVCALCEAKLAQADPYLATWFRDHVKPFHHDIHVSWSFRDATDQETAFRDGKTKLHYPDSPHNLLPSRAIDLFQLDASGHAVWCPRPFAALDAYNKTNCLSILWGGEFKSLGDYDHFQIKRTTASNDTSPASPPGSIHS